MTGITPRYSGTRGLSLVPAPRLCSIRARYAALALAGFVNLEYVDAVVAEIDAALWPAVCTREVGR